VRKCPGCKFMKADSEFTSEKAVTCVQCRRERAAGERRALRQAVLDLLGGRCACCGVSEYVFLDIDHINDDGAEDRRRAKGVATWRLALVEPQRFQVLCRNCNWAKFQGGCPHRADAP
jgi:hypothetical protein